MPKSLSADIKNDIKSALLAEKVSMEVANHFGATYAPVNNYANKFFPNRQRGLGGVRSDEEIDQISSFTRPIQDCKGSI
ncbi:hypothetical protein G6F43_014088 [Rhizopus delemar]|nr:hypothetical protein G6F43_014088 [Rhizopus delemar]